jgi:hypothetical protein
MVRACVRALCMYRTDGDRERAGEGWREGRGGEGRKQTYLTLPYLPTHLPLKKSVSQSVSHSEPLSWLQFNSPSLSSVILFYFRHYAPIRTGDARGAHGMRKYRVGVVVWCPAAGRTNKHPPSRCPGRKVAARPVGGRAWGGGLSIPIQTQTQKQEAKMIYCM